MVVHPGAGNYKNTLANALAYRYKDKLSNINTNLILRDYDMLDNRKYNEMNNFNSDFEYCSLNCKSR